MLEKCPICEGKMIVNCYAVETDDPPHRNTCESCKFSYSYKESNYDTVHKLIECLQKWSKGIDDLTLSMKKAADIKTVIEFGEKNDYDVDLMGFYIQNTTAKVFEEFKSALEL